MRITEAARRLGTSARMLRYREDLGLLPQVRDQLASPTRRSGASGWSGPSAHSGASDHSGTSTPFASSAPSASFTSWTTSAPSASSVPHGPAHRQFSEADLEAVAVALELERRYDISPASLAFGLRVLAEPAVRAAVADLGRRLGRIPATPVRALDFEKERALRLLSRG